MRTSISYLIALGLLAPTLGCIVRTEPHRGPAYREHEHERRACPPAHHWDHGRCVHNGNGRDHRHDD